MRPGLEFDTLVDRPDSLSTVVRPLAIWLGLTSFFVGAIAFGATLAAQSGPVETATGPMLLLLGVSLVGGGFLMEQTALFLDPEIEFRGRQWYVVAGASVCSLGLAIAAGALSIL
ncbi:MAG: hypothetical protein V5A45_01740 [Haloarculaceae archaeon]